MGSGLNLQSTWHLFGKSLELKEDQHRARGQTLDLLYV